MVYSLFRGKELLCGCVRLSQEPLETFSKIMLLFSVTNAWLNRDEDNDFSQVMYVISLSVFCLSVCDCLTVLSV